MDGPRTWEMYDKFGPTYMNSVPERIYRSLVTPKVVETFEDVMLIHTNDIFEKMFKELPTEAADSMKESIFSEVFNEVWKRYDLPKITMRSSLSLLFHEIHELEAGRQWRKGEKNSAEAAWENTKRHNSRFLKIIKPLTSMATDQQQKDVVLLWRLHIKCMKEYFELVPRYGYQEMEKIKKICLAFAAELGALLDILAVQKKREMNNPVIMAP